MSKLQINYSKLGVILLIVCMKNSDANLDPVKPFRDFDFEHIKSDIFTQSITEKCDNQSDTQNDLKCCNEISAIRNGHANMELWSMRIDALGKPPAGILDENFHWTFSDCFHIRQYETLYESKYCLGNFLVLNEIDSNRSEIDSVFGICLPQVCSLEFLRVVMRSNETTSISLHENTCQHKYFAGELTTIDCITIAILATLAFLIIASTTYDVLYSVYNREKSEALLAFSFYSNGAKLFSCKRSKSSDMMHCLDGIRVIVAAWIVLYHTLFTVRELPIRNMTFTTQFILQYYNAICYCAVSVDTFFLLSGILVSISLLRQFEQSKVKLNIPMLYFRRYLRLTPLLAISFLFSMSLLRFLGNGPQWPSKMDEWSQSCQRHWWSTLLYVQNYVNPDDLCFLHSWYLSVEMQLFIISPAFVYLIYRYKAKALFILGSLVFGCVGCTLAIHLKYGISNGHHPLGTAKAYLPTHTRYSSWLIGVMMGHFICATRGKTVHIPRYFNIFAWTLSLAAMVVIILAKYPFEQLNSQQTPLEYGLYISLSRIGWAVALCYIIFACIHNSGGIINEFLGHPLWQPLSRMSYAIYLMHYPVVLIVIVSFNSTFFYTELMFYGVFFGIFVLSVFVSIIATLAIESPLPILQKTVVHHLQQKSEKTRL